jgi:hypothetical protein
VVTGTMEFYDFPFHIWVVILPIDELIFFQMVKTTNHILGIVTPTDELHHFSEG